MYLIYPLFVNFYIVPELFCGLCVGNVRHAINIFVSLFL